MAKAWSTTQAVRAAIYALPIGVLGGLIGLGGAEFRLPVLVGPLGYTARQAVPLNLAISLVTLAAALVIRSRTLDLNGLAPLVVPILALITGAVISAFVGASLAHRLGKHQLERLIIMLLTAIGSALIIESFLPTSSRALVPSIAGWQLGVGLVCGVAIGLVSSLLGVAGGELIIPTMLFAFGADIKSAGTASLLISLPTVLVGLLRYAQRGAFGDRQPLKQTVAPMGCGSAFGAIIGGLLVGLLPAALLKFALGCILIISALRSFRQG